MEKIDLGLDKLLNDARLDFLFVENIAENIEHNKTIEKYYSTLFNELYEKKQLFDTISVHNYHPYEFTVKKKPVIRNPVSKSTPVWMSDKGITEIYGPKLPLLEPSEIEIVEPDIHKERHREEIQYNVDMALTKIRRKLKRLGQCQKKWIFDFYKESRIKDFKRTNLCEDKFCNNCKKVKQASRMGRYIPEIEKIKGKKVHLVLTQPNIYGIDLKDEINKILKAFTKLVEYLSGKKKIKGLDLDTWGFKAAVRSLEITFKGDWYHPHIHVLLVFDDDFELGAKTNVNLFSMKKGKVKNKFSDKEILIQKLWLLLLDDSMVNERKKKITKERIDAIQEGFSCFMEEFKEGHYYELFKYITKADGSGEKGNTDQAYFMTYDNFKTLYFALNGVHQIQGYGELYHIKEEPIDDTFESIYNALIEFLQNKEKPSRVSETPRAVQDNRGDYHYISRKKIHSFVKLYKVYQENDTTTTVNIVDQIEMTVD